jgi:glycerate 2-kinase
MYCHHGLRKSLWVVQPMDEDLKATLTRIFMAGLRAVDPEAAVRRHVELAGSRLRVGEHFYPLDRFERVIVIGAGKGTAPMAKALEDILGERLTSGFIIVKYGHGLTLQKIRVAEAGHPVPDQAGLDATQGMLAEIEHCTALDLVLCAFSGGGSALTPAPRPPLIFPEKQKATELLLASGASIEEVNALRKHLSLGKGGQLAQLASPATVVSLLLSDVVGDPLDVIASGPTVPDPSTFADCLKIIERYGLTKKLPAAVLKVLQEGAAGCIAETPKPGDAVFKKVQNLVVGSNRAALLAAAEEARLLGYNVLMLSSFMQGEAREIAQALTAIAKEIVYSDNPVPSPACVLAGGETTVTISGQGQGGRNQELALAAALALKGWAHMALLSAGTDGTDGPTDAAGAFADGETCRRAAQKGISPREYLANNDSYNFFDQLGQLFKTGPTRTNVMDLMCLLVDKRSNW